uniref:Capsid protein n=1 Tax=viral metagenome TaxID=1070528 RepID=A0A6M3L8F9_9ZZZZ
MPIGPYKDFGACVAAQKKKGKSDESARKICGHIEKMSKGKEKTIKTSKLNLEIKEDDGEFYTRGFIATTHIDDVDDRIVKETLESWSDKINSTNLPVSLHHDINDPTLVAKSISSSVKKLDDGEYGLWVETHYNKAHPEFENVHYEIDNDFLTNYSIEYTTNNDSTTHMEEIDGKWIRILEPETELVGYGLTNIRKAANKEAKLYKEIIDMKKDFEKKDEVKEKMKEEKPKEVVEKKEEEIIEKKEEDKEPEAPEDEETQEEEEGETKTKKAVKSEVKEAMIKELVKKELKEMMEKKPLLNETKEVKMETKEIKEYKEKVFGTKEGKADLASQWKSAGQLHDYLEKKTMGRVPSIGVSLPFECKENKIELKAADSGHVIPDNYTGAQTTWANIYGAYEEYPAELGAVYQPVIINQLNDEVSTWMLLDKVDFSNQSTITFIARWARNTDVGGYTEANAVATMTNEDFDGHVGRVKCHQIFSYYKADVSVSGPLMKFASAAGGIGDVYSKEIQDSTKDLMKAMNQALLSTGDGTAENACLGFEVLCITTGNIYAHARSTWSTLQAGGNDDMSSAPITLKKMRAMIRTACTNGARKQDLVFICDPLQEDFIKALIQDMQRIVPTSGVVGFTGLITLDGVPIFPDVDCQTDDLFLIDRAHTKIGLNTPPVYEELGKQGDSRRGIIKCYWNLYCTAPNHNYWIYGLATS